MKNFTSYLIVLLLSVSSLFGQQEYIDAQLAEKIYLHTDRPMYFPGETIWFKIYITDAHEQVGCLSDIVYAELIAPDGNSIEVANYAIIDGFAYGQFTVAEDWAGGIYTVKSYTNWMRNLGENSFFKKKITVQKVVTPVLQMKLDFDKESFGPGELVTLKVTLKDLENNLLKGAKSKFTISIGGKKHHQSNVTSNLEGILPISFKLPKDLDTTDALINVKVPYQGSTESISRSVPVTLDNIDLQLLPEAGVFLANMQNTVAFKAVDSYGKPADIAGFIKNNKGQIITKFESFHNGMGVFSMRPNDGETYTAHITSPFTSKKIYPLPEAVKKGVTIQVNSNTTETLGLSLFSSEKMKAILTVSDAKSELHNQVVYLQKGVTAIDLSAQHIPKGIAKIKLQSENKKYVAERLLFMNYNQQLNIEIAPDQARYNTRDKTNVSIRTTDQNGHPVVANLSVSVVDNKLLSFADDRQDHIISHLLMSTELKGAIYKPNFYFNPSESKALKALDYVMLTHGWRSYITNDALTISSAKYPLEQFSLQTGVVVDKKGTPVKANLILFNTKAQTALPFTTNDAGVFMFKIENQTSYTLVAYNGKKERLNIINDISTTPNTWESQRKLRIRNKDKSTEEVKARNHLKNPLPPKIKVKAKATSNLKLDPGASLDEVVVTGYGIRKEKKSLGYAVSFIESEEIENNLLSALAGKAAGISITTNEGLSGSGAQVKIRGANSFAGDHLALYVIDGVPISNGIVNDIKSPLTINPSAIESIKILKGLAATSLYGTQGRNGVILITTKEGNARNYFNHKVLNNKRFNNYTTHNYYKRNHFKNSLQLKFYAPVYEGLTGQDIERSDFRQTIYWNPVIQTNQNGEASFSYYNNDANTSFKITAEGLSANGLLGRAEKDYAVQSALAIDFKIPPYLTVDDEVELLVTLKNGSPKEIEGELSVLLPKEILDTQRQASYKVSVPPNGFCTQTVRIVPKAKISEANIKMSFKNEELQDHVSKKVTIISPYFPMESSLSGHKNAHFELPIENWVNGSMQAEFSIYTDVVGEVMDGVESLIRKPSGCFEQTSSSTYPNIMVLKYLKETGKINPEIEELALGYIKDGYKRLISFETSEGGFEWFGNTPPHETLTAFGILEFTEMKEVYNKVDQQMINRTVDWLMTRRDGNGGFLKSKKGYDSFASSPEDVANAYIVYALSEAGIAVDIEKEYQNALNDALKSKDSYKMALMACTAFNLNKTKDAEQLIGLCKTNIESAGLDALPVKNTITRSYGNDKQTETLAFTILAFLKDKKSDQFLLTRLVEQLLSSRKNKRFGATQATAMSLKALIEYTTAQNIKMLSDNQKVTLVLNGEKIERPLLAAPNGKLVINELEKHLIKGNNTVSISFLDSKQTYPYSLDLAWESSLPPSASCPVTMDIQMKSEHLKVGSTLRYTSKITNKNDTGLGMVTSIVGIPAGTSAQPWQLKELVEENKIDYYELFDNYIVFYWRSFKKKEIKTIDLDLKAEVAGTYTAPASSVYLYYGEEFKQWIPGVTIKINK